MMGVSYQQAVRYRLAVNNLIERLPPGSYLAAARYGLQDTAPRDALIGMHARVEACEESAWEAPGLVQTYSPRAAVYVLPELDFGVFTIGRMPLKPERRRAIEEQAEEFCRKLDGAERAGSIDPALRGICASGRLALRWTASSLYVREVPRPEVDFLEAHQELCRRHVRAFGPTTPEAFAWWAGLPKADGAEVWRMIAAELTEVDFEGRPAWILADAEDTLRKAPEPWGVRFLVTSDLRLLGQNKDGLFVGPGQRKLSDLLNWSYPHGLMLDGAIVGVWGRKGGTVQVRTQAPLPRDLIEAEALSMPIPGAAMALVIAEDE